MLLGMSLRKKYSFHRSLLLQNEEYLTCHQYQKCLIKLQFENKVNLSTHQLKILKLLNEKSLKFDWKDEVRFNREKTDFQKWNKRNYPNLNKMCQWYKLLLIPNQLNTLLLGLKNKKNPNMIVNEHKSERRNENVN